MWQRRKKQVHMQDNNQICQYKRDRMLTIAHIIQYLQHVLLE